VTGSTGPGEGRVDGRLRGQVEAILAVGDRLRVAESVSWWERAVEATGFYERWEYLAGGRWRRYWRRYGSLPRRLRKEARDV
jgi:hypothetical protein